jgi:hypothetical protein
MVLARSGTTWVDEWIIEGCTGISQQHSAVWIEALKRWWDWMIPPSQRMKDINCVLLKPQMVKYQRSLYPQKVLIEHEATGTILLKNIWNIQSGMYLGSTLYSAKAKWRIINYSLLCLFLSNNLISNVCLSIPLIFFPSCLNLSQE